MYSTYTLHASEIGYFIVSYLLIKLVDIKICRVLIHYMLQR